MGEERSPVDFNKIKVGASKLQSDVVAILDEYAQARQARPFKQRDVYRAIERRDLPELRRMSSYFFDKSGIYQRLCRYMADLYRCDWNVVPIRKDASVRDDKVVEGWFKACSFLEESDVKGVFSEVALKVVKNGCFYGYRVRQTGAEYLQEFPCDYCRTRYEHNGRAAFEFNVKFFDDRFKDANYRMRVVRMFPKEVQRAYVAYKNGTLPKDFQGDASGWFLIDPESSVKFSLGGGDVPVFASTIPAILDLEDAKELDKKRTAQQLLRIVIQKMPLDDNYNLVFDLDEVQQLHNNAVEMLGSSIGVDVLTTFADVDVADLSDSSATSTSDPLEKMERAVFNEAGVSEMQFNTDGNLALSESRANDAAVMGTYLRQFERYMNDMLAPFNKNPRRLRYKASVLPTTVYNFQDMASAYQTQATLGYSKFLPAVAMGSTPLEVLASAQFENGVLGITDVLEPVRSSSTLSSSDDEGGRPETPDDEKAQGTIDNIESR